MYMQQVKKNAQALASALLRRNCRLITGGTDNHMLLWDLRNFGLTGMQLYILFSFFYILLENYVEVCVYSSGSYNCDMILDLHSSHLLLHNEYKNSTISLVCPAPDIN